MASQETILIADDSEINRAILHGLFKEEYNLLEAENGEQALMLVRQYRESIAVVLLDLIMPEKDGYEVLEEMRRDKLIFHEPVVVITAEDSADNRVKVFELGASDIIAKPFEPEIVKSRVKNIIELGRYRRSLEALVEEQSIRVNESNIAVIDMLSSVVEHRSLESGLHIRRIRMYTKILLEEVARNYQEYHLDARKIRLITESSSMHDIGKIAIPDSILNKPGKLSPEEFEVMKTHTVKGCEILSGLDRLQDPEYLQYAYYICSYHHERWDGSGYPDGLKGNSIPICAQVVAIADCYDALTTDRVYKKAISPSRAFSMILNGECGMFSPQLLECFKNVREQFERLSKEYADGVRNVRDSEARTVEDAPVWEAEESIEGQGRLKYFTLMRYLDCTVMEADLNTGIFHLVYLADQSFASLQSGDSFEESIRTFVDTAVHPDDKDEVLRLLDDYTRELFDEGMLLRERRYRIRDCVTGDYVMYQAALLRVNLDIPRQRHIMLIWCREDAAVPDRNRIRDFMPSIERNPIMNHLLGGINKCSSDRYFTLLKICRKLVDITGYSEKEIEETYQNHLINLIYPADRERVVQQFREQREKGNILELEYRLTTKEGRIVWVSSRCLAVREQGTEVTYGILTDITRSKLTEEKLRLSLEQHNIIMDQTDDIIFEWDFLKDELHLSSNWEKQYGYTPVTKNVRVEIPRASHIHPGDMPEFISLMEAVLAGVPYKEADFRIVDAASKYRWRRVRATVQYDLDRKPFKAIGVIQDIDTQKKASEELERRKSHDMLTGLYNREGAQTRVESYLAECGLDELSAMMILDVDDFGQVNKHYGRMFGDAVLKKLSDCILKLFRSDDTVARIGGDEFLIFMPRVHTEHVAEQRAVDMLAILENILSDNQDGSVLTCSIGLSFAHGSQSSFQTLMEHADWALCHAKASGKNQYECYKKEAEVNPICEVSPPAILQRTIIESDRTGQWNLPHLVIRALRILYDTVDFSEAVQSVLGMVGTLFGASYTYIFESGSDMEHYSNTHEWHAETMTPYMQELRDLPYLEDGMDYRDFFDDNALFYCQNLHMLDSRKRHLLKRKGTRSTIQYAIKEAGKFYGFVGLDDCQNSRLWTEEQIEILTMIGKLLAVFFLYHKKEVRYDLELQAAEQQRLARRYDHLFHSVLCGIVQYRLEGRKVIFKNANKEAIRLFGYTREEFWAKQDWDLADLIAEEDRDYMLKAASKLSGAGGKGEFEYRLLQKDGTSRWIIGSAEVILDSDGEQVIQSVYLDIDARKKAEKNNQRFAKQMEASNEILCRALEHTSSCIFYYYPQTRTCTVPERTCSLLHCRKYYDKMPEQFALEQVDETYRPVFSDMYQRIHGGERTASCEFRGMEGNFWYRQIMSVIQNNEDGAPEFVIGIIEDLTRQKETEAALQTARSCDQLTGLYNRECGIAMIKEYLVHQRKADETCVLMVLDMDDFSKISQAEGSVFANVILQETADIIRSETGKNDIQVRTGSEEFMIFVKDCDDEQGNAMGRKISTGVKNILAGSDDSIRVSISIGLCSTNVSEEFSSLYRCAGIALKEVKAHHKGDLSCYTDTTVEKEQFLNRFDMAESPSAPISQTSLSQDQDLVSFAIELLGKARNLNDAVNLLLARIGKKFNFDRVSIIENNRFYLSYHFAYQWARNRADMQLGEEFYVSEEDFKNSSSLYDEEGLCDHNIKDGISHIASCLHAGIWDYGEYAGSMSFEINQENYQWTGEQRKLLKELVKIVPSFIMKSKADAVSQAKTNFLSRMSHEIRTPMNAINGMTEIAKSAVGNQDKVMECLEKIESANEYLLSLINDILEMNQIESGKMELNLDAVYLFELMNDLESMFHIQAEEKGIRLSFINEYNQFMRIQADPLRLKQVLVNIIGNAIKFTKHGSVSVCVETVKSEPRAVLRFSVKDTGIGIAPGMQARIFNSFEQAEGSIASNYGGTGLGLAISQRLVQMMGGKLEVCSKIEKGSEFFFTLELEYAPEMPPEEEHSEGEKKEQKASRGNAGEKRILLVEDNELNCEIAQTLLEMNGFAVTCAANGQEALERFWACDSGTFDAILMDIRMPVMDGLEATRRIRTSGRADARKIPIIALSANAFDEDTRKSMASGMNGHLSKPIQISQMLEILDKYINQK